MWANHLLFIWQIRLKQEGDFGWNPIFFQVSESNRNRKNSFHQETLEPGGGFYVLDELFSEKKPQADGGGSKEMGGFFFLICRWCCFFLFFLAEWGLLFPKQEKVCIYIIHTHLYIL